MYTVIQLSDAPQSSFYAASLNWADANSNEVTSGFTTMSSNDLVFQGDIDNDGVVEVAEYPVNAPQHFAIRPPPISTTYLLIRTASNYWRLNSGSVIQFRIWYLPKMCFRPGEPKQKFWSAG
jgi:hypothetical protein